MNLTSYDLMKASKSQINLKPYPDKSPVSLDVTEPEMKIHFNVGGKLITRYRERDTDI